MASIEVEVPGATLYAERLGAGPTLLFLNGSGTSIDESRPLLELLAASFDLVVFDQRGMGRSSVPEDPWAMADLASDCHHVLDAFGLDHAAVLGLSFGGMVALEFCVTWPEVVDQLVLWCTSAGGTLGSSYPLHQLAALEEEERSRLATRLLDRRFTPEWLTTHPGDQALVALRAASPPPSGERARGIALQLAARADHDVSSRLEAISCPTLVGAGRYDDLAPVANSEAMAGRIAGARLEVYDGGHLFFLQDPRAFEDARRFLAS